MKKELKRLKKLNREMLELLNEADVIMWGVGQMRDELHFRELEKVRKRIAKLTVRIDENKT